MMYDLGTHFEIARMERVARLREAPLREQWSRLPKPPAGRQRPTPNGLPLARRRLRLRWHRARELSESWMLEGWR